jgi:hypothetical protein
MKYNVNISGVTFNGGFKNEFTVYDEQMKVIAVGKTSLFLNQNGLVIDGVNYGNYQSAFYTGNPSTLYVSGNLVITGKYSKITI